MLRDSTTTGWTSVPTVRMPCWRWETAENPSAHARATEARTPSEMTRIRPGVVAAAARARRTRPAPIPCGPWSLGAGRPSDDVAIGPAMINAPFLTTGVWEARGSIG